MALETPKYMKTKIGKIPANWKVFKLNNIADIKFSNVDKKTVADELPVFLCNYLDVYNNCYITNKINFMPATATEREINKFRLMKGDILLTKDSETPDDIAVPSVVIEDLKNIVCGYHLAMLRPNPNLVQSIYLSKVLLSKPINNQFVRLAHGLTRFGLNVSTFEKVIIPVPPLSEQRKIAEILSTVDADIQKTDAIIKETQQLKKGLMEKLFTEGIGHTRFKNTKIGRIPEEWGAVKFETLAKFSQGIQIPNSELLREKPTDKLYRYLYINDFFSDTKVYYTTETNRKYLVEKRDLVMVNTGNTSGKLLNGKEGILCNNAFKISIDEKKLNRSYIYQYLISNFYWKQLLRTFNQGSQPHLGHKNIGRILIILPPMNEQIKIASIFTEMDNKIDNEQSFRIELEQLKKGLLQVLLTGKVRVKV